MKNKIFIEYIDAEETWAGVSESLLITCLKSCNIAYTWIGGTYLFPNESLDERIISHAKGAYWLMSSWAIKNITAIRTIDNRFTSYTIILNIFSQQIIHDVSRALKLKAFL